MIRPGSRERWIRTALLIAGDFGIAWLTLAVAVYARRTMPLPFTRALLPAEKLPVDLRAALLFGGSFLAALALAGFYRARVLARARPILGVALLIQIALIAIGGTLLERPLPRTILFAVPLFEALLFPLWRMAQQRLWPVRPRDTLLVGERREVAAALDVIRSARDERIRVIAYGSLDDPHVRDVARDIEEVICVSADDQLKRRLELLRIRGPRGYMLLASPADALLVSSVLGWMGDEPLIEVRIGCGFGIRAAIKRAIDIIGSALLLVVASPLWITIAIAAWLDDGRPLFLRQPRLGLGGTTFGMWKFRSMRDGAPTRVGRLLRRYRLDELPQLVNVLTGDMSLVGPRPEQPQIAEKIMEEVPDFDLRCLVRPGIAGLAQILAEYDSRPAVKLRYDLTYMCSWSLWLDLRLLLSSVAAALSGSGI